MVAVTTQFIGVVTVVIFGGFDINVFGLDIRARTPQRLIGSSPARQRCC